MSPGNGCGYFRSPVNTLSSWLGFGNGTGLGWTVFKQSLPVY